MNKVIVQLFTELDNKTFDIAKVLAALSIVVSWVLQSYALYTGQAFDIQAFCIGQGTLLGGAGVAWGLKKENTGGIND